jgi:hypothetical protein
VSGVKAEPVGPGTRRLLKREAGAQSVQIAVGHGIIVERAIIGQELVACGLSVRVGAGGVNYGGAAATFSPGKSVKLWFDPGLTPSSSSLFQRAWLLGIKLQGSCSSSLNIGHWTWCFRRLLISV